MAQPQNQTQNQIVKALSDFADGHLQINSFQFGYPFEFATSGDTIFPQLFVTPLDHRYSNKSFEYNYRLIFADIVGKGERNRDDVLSDQLEIAKDLIAQLSHPDYPFIFDMSNVRLEDFFEQFSESNSGIDVSGYMAEILIKVPFDNNRCFIPTDGIGITISEDQNLVIITDANNPNSPISINAGGTYTCVPATSTSDLTCQNLNDDLTQAQRQLIQQVNHIKTGQTISYDTDDDGALEKGRLVDFLTLDCNNSFGNTNRFTDSVGGQDYDGTGGSISDYVIDHSTGIAYQWNTNFSVFALATWATAISNANAHDNGTFSDFYLPNINQLFSIANHGAATSLFNYAPINNSLGVFLWSGTTLNSNTLRAQVVQSTAAVVIVGAQKIGSDHYIYARNHF